MASSMLSGKKKLSEMMGKRHRVEMKFKNIEG